LSNAALGGQKIFKKLETTNPGSQDLEMLFSDMDLTSGYA